MKLKSIAFLLALSLSSHADEAAKTKLMAAGQMAYASCIACHAPDGKGTPAGPKKMAPALSGSPFVTDDPAVLALVIMKGVAKENQDYLGMMAPMEAVVSTDEKLAGLLTYLRNSFGNTASVVTEEDAKKFREQWKDIKAPVNRAKLQELEEAAKKK